MRAIMSDKNEEAMSRESLDIADSNALSARLSSVADALVNHILQFGISKTDATAIEALIDLMGTFLRHLRQSAVRDADD